jgi:hypothetical protein
MPFVSPRRIAMVVSRAGQLFAKIQQIKLPLSIRRRKSAANGFCDAARLSGAPGMRQDLSDHLHFNADIHRCPQPVSGQRRQPFKKTYLYLPPPYPDFSKISRPISMRRISEVPAPIS